MSYIKAETILPQELIILIQEYADGQYLYIPRKEANRKSWGENTDSKNKVQIRDNEIYLEYLAGTNYDTLADQFYLSLKSIQRIISKEKKNVGKSLCVCKTESK